jgi:hypothetical protein
MGYFVGILYFTPVLFIGLLLLLVLVVAVLVHRFLKWSRFVSTALGFGLAIAIGGYSHWFLVTNISSSKDRDEAAAVASILRAEYPFAMDRDGGPRFNIRPHPKRTEFIVFGVVDPAEQDKIVEITRRARAAVPHKPLILTFKPQARYRGSPTGVQTRIDEDPLRVERIEN